MGSSLYCLPGASGPGRDLTSAPLVLLSCPDDYLLELERTDREAAWQAANPEGEVITIAAAPPATALLRELATPSLFAPRRLVVVRDARLYLGGEEHKEREAEALVRALDAFSFSNVSLILAAVTATEPKGALVDLAARRGEARFVELPPPPKPWEKTTVSPAQRRLLESLLVRVAPALAGKSDVMAALCEVHGFAPRQLAQAATQLVLLGALTVEAVHAQAGLGERSLKELEEALTTRSGPRAARFFAALLAGGELRGWWGNLVGREELGRVLGNAVGKLLRQALAVRGHARRAGLEAELDPRKCAADRWYNNTFRQRIYAALEKEIASHPASPVAKMSPWALHLVFKLAAGYDDAALLQALARLGANRVELAQGAEAVAAVCAPVMELLTSRAAPAGRKARGG